MWLSIVIPVHNAEKYLARCLDSILGSRERLAKESEKLGKRPELEILLVDNRSGDRSAEIAKQYREQYPKLFKYFTQETPGAAATRNFGAKKAQGEYIWFVDADDYIDEAALVELWKASLGGGSKEVGSTGQSAESIKSGKAHGEAPDLISFTAAQLDRGGKELRKLSAIDPNMPDYRSRFVRYGLGPWHLLIRRRLWEENDLAFPEGMIHEDMALMSALILYAKKLAGVPKTLYYYCDNPGSVLHKSEYNPQIFDIFPALSALSLRFEKEGADKKYAEELEWFFVWNLLIDSAKDFRAFPEGRKGIRQTREFMKFYYPGWRKNKFLKQKPLKLRLKVRLNYWGV